MRRSLSVLLLWLLAAAPLAAQQNRRPDPALATASAAFERFDMAERRAIQRDLIWVSGFQGAATGEFGPLTFAALRRLDETLKKPVDGVMNAEKRRALANAAEAARKNMAFRIETDSTSGMRIGVPGKVLSKRSTNPAGLSRWQDADGKITLDLSIGKPEDDLAQLFERGSATNVAGRKITYKLLRPEFFVISGETQTGKFYRRLEKGKDGKLRGFSLGYDKSLAGGFDWMVIAIAASFEAEPGQQPTTVAAANPSATTTAQTPARPVVVEPRRLTAIEIAPGRLLTSAASLEKCRSVTFGSPAVTLQVEKKANGLALLGLPRPGGATVGLAAAADSSAIVLQRGRAGELMIGEARIAEAQAEVPLQAGGGGAPLIDRNGQLQGIIIEEPRDKVQIAGVIIASRYRIATVKEIAAFADLQPVAATAPRAMSAVATEAGRSVLGLTCVE